MSFAGIDRLQYPGNDFMSGLMQNTDLLWTGFYLAPAPSQSNTSWMTHLADLRAMGPGWGIAPIFVGQQHPSGRGSHTLTAAQGRQDALRAAELADQAGFTAAGEADLPGAPRIYLDIEIGGNLPHDFLTYVNEWCGVIRSETAYLPAVYCSFKNTATQIFIANPDLVVWVFNINQFLHHHDRAMVASGEFLKPDPATSGFPSATAWQWIQNLASITTTLPNGASQTLATWDLDVSIAPDPSHPDRQFDTTAGTWLLGGNPAAEALTQEDDDVKATYVQHDGHPEVFIAGLGITPRHVLLFADAEFVGDLTGVKIVQVPAGPGAIAVQDTAGTTRQVQVVDDKGARLYGLPTAG
jgi:Rv2525c-like, glycoside hydrolase-like domain